MSFMWPNYFYFKIIWVSVAFGVDHGHSEDILSQVQEEIVVFQFVPAASCPLTGQHCEDSDSVFFASSHEVSVHIDKVSLRHLFSRLNSPCSLSSLSAQSLSHLCGSLSNMHQCVPELCRCTFFGSKNTFKMHLSVLRANFL